MPKRSPDNIQNNENHDKPITKDDAVEIQSGMSTSPISDIILKKWNGFCRRCVHL